MDGQGDLCSARLSERFLKIESEEVGRKAIKKQRSAGLVIEYSVLIMNKRTTWKNLPSDEHVCHFVSLF